MTDFKNGQTVRVGGTGPLAGKRVTFLHYTFFMWGRYAVVEDAYGNAWTVSPVLIKAVGRG